jgi:hypothetical protein
MKVKNETTFTKTDNRKIKRMYSHRSWDSSVGIETGYVLDGIDSQWLAVSMEAEELHC